MSFTKARFSALSIDDGPEWFGEVTAPEQVGIQFTVRSSRVGSNRTLFLKAHLKRNNYAASYINGFWDLTQKCVLIRCRQTKYNDLELLDNSSERTSQSHFAEC